LQQQTTSWSKVQMLQTDKIHREPTDTFNLHYRIIPYMLLLAPTCSNL